LEGEMANPPKKKKKKSKTRGSFGGGGNPAAVQAADERADSAERKAGKWKMTFQERSFQDRLAVAGGLLVGQGVAVNAAEVARLDPGGMGAAINYGLGLVGGTVGILVDHPAALAASVALGSSATAQTAIMVFCGKGIYGKRSKAVKVTVTRPEPPKK
jgi:hypothetical protein